MRVRVPRPNDVQVDARDSLRPLNYRGRILEGAISKVAARDHVFKNSPILRDGRTEVATQVSAKDLLVIETADDTNPDNCLSEDDPIQGGKKVEQIACNACEKILNGMLDGMQITGRASVFVIDLHMTVGNMFEAFVKLRSKFNFPIFFIGATGDEETLEWFNEHKTEPRWHFIL